MLEAVAERLYVFGELRWDIYLRSARRESFEGHREIATGNKQEGGIGAQAVEWFADLLRARPGQQVPRIKSMPSANRLDVAESLDLHQHRLRRTDGQVQRLSSRAFVRRPRRLWPILPASAKTV